MRLAKIRIQNFRSFKDEEIELDTYTCFVGPNGAGKSTVLAALNVFFRETSAATNILTLCEEDFHRKNKDDPVKISLTFRDLTPEAIELLTHYYRQNELTIFARAVWNSETGNAPVTQHGERMVMRDFAPFFEAVDAKEKAAKQKEVYSKIREGYPELDPPGTMEQMKSALRAYEEAHPEKCQPHEDSAEFYGFTRGSYRLEPFIQWVYVPAVKDAASEEQENKKTAIGKIVARIRADVDFKPALKELKEETEEKYKEILKPEQEKLKALEQRLGERFRQWSSPDSRLSLDWDYDPQKSLVIDEPFAQIRIGEGGFLGSVARLGHGMQRSLLVTVLQELASGDASRGPHLILGIEEPELYQHPPQAQHLADVLQQLANSEEGNSQVLVTTHSPYFASCDHFEQVRMVRKSPPNWETNVRQARFEQISSMLAGALGEAAQHPTEMMGRMMQVMQPSQRELFFSRVAVIVEGVEDIAYVATHLHLTGKWAAFRESGCHFIVGGGKTNVSRPLAIANALQIPVFVIIDSDAHKKNENERKENARRNGCILALCGHKDQNALPEDDVFLPSLVIWKSTIGDVVKEGIGQQTWEAAYRAVRDELALEDDQKLYPKNTHVIAATLEMLWRKQQTSEKLSQLCDQILMFASSCG